VTARDRTVLIVVGMLALLGGFWFLAISPKRKDASDVAAQLSAAQSRLDTAQASAASAEAARKQYSTDYATVARLGKAVPVDDDMPSLVYQLSHTAKVNHVDFRAIKLTSTGGQAAVAPVGAAAAVASATGNTTATASSSTPAATVTTALPPGALVGTAGFPTMPFSFDFTGSFFHMQRFLKAIDGLTAVNGKSINVKGRLLTVDGVGLKAGPKGFPDVDATVAVTAYLLPADEGLTAGATPTTPGTPTTGSTATASLIGSDR
jgi:type II secretory pathway pseudopilin PulG